MKASLLFAVAAMTLAACQPTTAPASEAAKPPEAAGAAPPSDTTASTGCNAHAEAAWGPIGPSDHPSYRIEAYTNGSICEVAVVTLTIRARDGYPAYTWASGADHLFGLSGHPDVAAMNKALAEWMDPNATTLKTTGDLPPWEETDGQPKRAEFPFMPPEWIDQKTYDAMKAEKLPVYCFPQGMESLKCVALNNGEIDDIGLQLFPG